MHWTQVLYQLGCISASDVGLGKLRLTSNSHSSCSSLWIAGAIDTYRIVFAFIELGERHEEEEVVTFYLRDRADHMCHCCAFYDGRCGHGDFQTLDVICCKTDESFYFSTQFPDRSAGTN